MGLFDKLASFIYEDEQGNKRGNKEATSKGSSNLEKKNKWTDIFFEDVPSEGGNKHKKRSFIDLFFEEVPDDGIKSTFVENEEVSMLDDILTQIEQKESELINLAEVFKTVNATDYPDSASEYEAYLSLVKQLNEIKEQIASNQDLTMNLMKKYQIEDDFRRFELEFQTHINAIQSLCYLSEISVLNKVMERLFSSKFTEKIKQKIGKIEEYIKLISKKSNMFDKKYSARLYKQLIEAEYRVTILKLMIELQNGKVPNRNPFSNSSEQKKKIFETYLSKDIRDSNAMYNTIANNRDMYVKYNLIEASCFNKLDVEAEGISNKITLYTIDDFLLDELLEDGEGFETLVRFLRFKLMLNFIDSKTQKANERFMDEKYNKSKHGGDVAKKEKKESKNIRRYDEER